ncbi:MAG TPA: M14 family zinc carboxypeptidase [Flavobacteriales bacterium]|nr:M14 family zinc carboxypeptidase [Flavobacteriales bacterium]
MRARALFIFFLALVQPAFSQHFSRVKVFANDSQKQILAEKGVCLDHGKHKENLWIETDLSTSEINLLDENGIHYEVVIENVVEHYEKQISQGISRVVPTCNQYPHTYTDPVHFKLGSMGGYPTYAQILSELDSMVILYPALVNAKAAIGAHVTANGNNIFWTKISDNPGVDENEPEILITALHHAREPGSITQLLYFMWHLLENYGTDPEITYLIDHTEIYFIPVVNPDGYLQNQITNPSGGGMWRKNRRNNGDGTFGVDLNRNYSYQWGVSGASATTSSDIYRGPSAFSEPETKAVRDFVYAHSFDLALNYHTFGNLLLYPYGYANVNAVDQNYFETATDLMVCDNGFANIQAVDLYAASGDSDDWMYGDTLTKPRVFAITPEVGPDAYGFWPPSAQIKNIAKDNLFANITALNLLHYYCNVNETNNAIFRNLTPTQQFKFNLQKLGLQDTGSTTVALIPISPEIISVGSPKTYTNLAGFVSIIDSIDFTLAMGTPGGAQLTFVLQTTNPSGIINDTVVKFFGQPYAFYSNDFTSLGAFTNVGFSTTTATFVSAGSAVTESPIGNYGAGVNKALTTADVAIPSTALFAQLSFYAKWDIEDRYDYAQVLISDNAGLSYTPLCGRYTTPGSADQDLNDPVYDATMSDWVFEEINLNAYIGQTVRIRLAFKSDSGVEKDGFYMDDLKIEIIDPNGINETSVTGGVHVYPNPVNDEIFIKNDLNEKEFLLLDQAGRIVKQGKLGVGETKMALGSFEAGNYILTVKCANGVKCNHKLIVIK